MTASDTFIRGLPKAELHMHIEGSIEPEMMLALARRNDIDLPWKSTAALQAAYEFSDLQSFLNVYFEGCRVLVDEQDFYDVTYAYLRRAREDGVVRAELFIGPQSFTTRGVSMSSLMGGVLHAIEDGERAFGLSAGLMISVHRHRTEADALEVLKHIEPWSDRVIAIGMGGAERGNPPSKFVNFFRACRERGYRTTVHAGEEGPADYVREAVEVLKVDRIDHGNACLDDPDLVAMLAARRVPLTVCPISNLKLNVVSSLAKHPLRRLMEAGLNVTINSDDPPYFGAYVTENLAACRDALDLSVDEVVGLARNSLMAAFVDPGARETLLTRLDGYVANAGLIFLH